ncbi:MAG: helix-turn-helix transcriptional regulator [Stellaceae bacterium]
MRCSQTYSIETLKADLGCKINFVGDKEPTAVLPVNKPVAFADRNRNGELRRELTIADKQYLTPAQLAKTLGISPRTLARWHAIGTGPPRTKIGKLVLYDASRLPEWLASATKLA